MNVKPDIRMLGLEASVVLSMWTVEAK